MRRGVRGGGAHHFLKIRTVVERDHERGRKKAHVGQDAADAVAVCIEHWSDDLLTT